MFFLKLFFILPIVYSLSIHYISYKNDINLNNYILYDWDEFFMYSLLKKNCPDLPLYPIDDVLLLDDSIYISPSYYKIINSTDIYHDFFKSSLECSSQLNIYHFGLYNYLIHNLNTFDCNIGYDCSNAYYQYIQSKNNYYLILSNLKSCKRGESILPSFSKSKLLDLKISFSYYDIKYYILNKLDIFNLWELDLLNLNNYINNTYNYGLYINGEKYSCHKYLFNNIKKNIF